MLSNQKSMARLNPSGENSLVFIKNCDIEVGNVLLISTHVLGRMKPVTVHPGVLHLTLLIGCDAHTELLKCAINLPVCFEFTR